MNDAPTATKIRSTVTLITTMIALAVADSRIPMIRSPAMARPTKIAGRLKSAAIVDPSVNVMTVPGEAVSWAGTLIPKSRRKLTM